ncbi:MAG: hypothetical protein AB7V16_06710 [Vulcanibacillus sp.]
MNIVLVTFLITLILFPVYIILLKKVGSVQENFNNIQVPTSIGIFIFFGEAIVLFTYNDQVFMSVWVYLITMTIMGTIDDFFGDKNIKGLRNHLKLIFQTKVTTGFLKALTGGLISLLITIKFGNNIFEYVTHFFLILFMINAINLFDLRPGRALKVFFMFILILGISIPLLSNNFILVVTSLLLVVFYYDVRGKVMMGDSGSNLIGLHIGIFYSIYMPISVQWLLIILLLFLHIYTEKYSLSRLINNNRVLLSIDLWFTK